MTVTLSFIGGAGWQFFDDNGVPLAGGKLYTYAAGTTLPLTTYTSRDGLTPNTNPIILDAAGRTPQQIWSTEGVLYKYVIKTSADILIRSWDNIGGSTVASDLGIDLANTTNNDKGDALVGFKQANSSGFLTGAVARTVSTKLQEHVSVLDFGADPTGVTDSTQAIQAAVDAAKRIYFPAGTYLVSRAIRVNQLANGRILYGDGKEQTSIARYDTTPEVIDGETCVCVIFVSHGDHHLLSMRIVGAAAVTSAGYQVDGIYSPGQYRGKFENLMIDRTKRAIYSKVPWLMTYQNVLVRNASETAFDFSANTSGKTSLIFNNCVCENVGNAFILVYCYYTVMNACAADYVNYTPLGNPYGFGYGSRATDRAVYDFYGGDIVMNGCGTENSYGNGFVNLGRDQSTNVTVNNCTAFSVKSEYVPPVGYGTGYAVGCLQAGNGPINLTINGGRYTYENLLAPVVADLVAFNYDEGAYGARNLCMVNLGSTVIPTNLQNAFAGRGDYNRFCRIPINYRNQYTRRLTGTGTTITIPIVSQSDSTQRHVIRILGVNRAPSSSSAYGTEATIDFASLTTIIAISYWNSKNIASVTAAGMNLQINLTNALVNPEIVVEPLSTNQKLIDVNNITIA